MLKQVALAALLLAQWLNCPAPGVPRLPNGKVDLSAKPPRTRDGKADLSGVWQTELESADPNTFSRYFFNIFSDFTADNAPMKPETAEYMRRVGERKAGNPSGLCLPHGLPQADS